MVDYLDRVSPLAHSLSLSPLTLTVILSFSLYRALPRALPRACALAFSLSPPDACIDVTDDRDIITCKMVSIEGKRLKKALTLSKLRFLPMGNGDWMSSSGGGFAVSKSKHR